MKTLLSVLALSFPFAAQAFDATSALCSSRRGGTVVAVEQVTDLEADATEGKAQGSMFLVKFKGQSVNERFALEGTYRWSAKGKYYELSDSKGYQLFLASAGGSRNSVTVGGSTVLIDCQEQ